MNIKINDFNLFYDTMKSLGKISSAAKLTINETGLIVYGRNSVARCEITSDAVVTDDEISFCIKDMSMLNKLLSTINEVHNKDFSGLKFSFDGTFFKMESKKFKTKIITCKENIIITNISDKITTKLTPIFEFTTTSQLIKTVNNHSFIFDNNDDARVYLNVKPEMENNVIYATVGNETSELNNAVTLKFGLVNFGDLNGNTIILDFDRINLFNIVQSDNIVIQVMAQGVLVYKISKKNNNGNYSNIIIYNSKRKK